MHNEQDPTKDQDIKDKSCLDDFELDNEEAQQMIGKEDRQVNLSIQILNKRKEMVLNELIFLL